MSKDYSMLTIADNFMFTKVFSYNEDLCKELIEIILGIKVKRLVKVEKESSVEITADNRGVRFDVWAEDDENTVYDVDYSDFQIIPINPPEPSLS